MILLDTNVLSALMQAAPPEPVIAWLDRQPAESIWTTALTLFEIHHGIGRLPVGRRRERLCEQVERLLVLVLRGRVLAFDSGAARRAGLLAAERAAIGQTVEVRDAQIAGIALARNAVVATRNQRHFEPLCPIVNPWDAAS